LFPRVKINLPYSNIKETAATNLNTGSSQSIQSKGLSLDWSGLVSGLPVPADALLTKALHYTVVVPDVIVCPLVSNLPSLRCAFNVFILMSILVVGQPPLPSPHCAESQLSSLRKCLQLPLNPPLCRRCQSKGPCGAARCSTHLSCANSRPPALPKQLSRLIVMPTV
jgi:hypothetical protein